MEGKRVGLHEDALGKEKTLEKCDAAIVKAILTVNAFGSAFRPIFLAPDT